MWTKYCRVESANWGNVKIQEFFPKGWAVPVSTESRSQLTLEVHKEWCFFPWYYLFISCIFLLRIGMQSFSAQFTLFKVMIGPWQWGTGALWEACLMCPILKATGYVMVSYMNDCCS